MQPQVQVRRPRIPPTMVRATPAAEPVPETPAAEPAIGMSEKVRRLWDEREDVLQNVEAGTAEILDAKKRIGRLERRVRKLEQARLPKKRR